MLQTFLKMSYESKLSVFDTQKAIHFIKNIFEDDISNKLNLTRVTAPLVMEISSGLNNNLAGSDPTVKFESKSGIGLSFIYALGRWKRYALRKYGFELYQGLMADAHSVRKAEDLDPLHSYCADILSWERIIKKEDRNMIFLEAVVRDIYECLKKTEGELLKVFPILSKKLPEEIKFVSSQQLEDEYPDLTWKERESKCTEKNGAVFITQIGKRLKSGKVHDRRTPDVDDWELNGDILVHYGGKAFELSSMGIRVTGENLSKQLAERDQFKRLSGPFHKALVANELPYTIGGGIGKSRMCMFFLDKKHIGECQASVWDQNTIEECEKNNIKLL